MMWYVLALDQLSINAIIMYVFNLLLVVPDGTVGGKKTAHGWIHNIPNTLGTQGWFLIGYTLAVW